MPNYSSCRNNYEANNYDNDRKHYEIYYTQIAQTNPRHGAIKWYIPQSE